MRRRPLYEAESHYMLELISNEYVQFERYVEYHIQNLRDRVDAQNEYSYVRADSEAETRFIIHRLRTARVLQSILKEYREWVKNHC